MAMNTAPRFPRIHNFGQAHIEGSQMTFTYFDSHGKIMTETKYILPPSKIARRTADRHARFKSLPPGTRESEYSRKERKWISAHPIGELRKAWALMDKETKMEFEMMFDRSSHTGISDPAWASEHRSIMVQGVKGDDGEAMG